MKAIDVLVIGPKDARGSVLSTLDRIWTVAGKDIRDLLSGKSYLYLIIMCIICIPYFDGAKSVLSNLTNQGASSEELHLAAQSFLGSMAFNLPLMLAMLFCPVVGAYSILVDKSKRTFESLLVTPMSLREIWMGKTLGVALPGIVVGEVISLAAILAVDLAVVAPVTGSIVAPAALPIVGALVISPILVFEMVAITSLLRLIITNPKIPTFAFTAIFMAIYAVTVIVHVPANWAFAAIYAGAAAVLGMAAVFLTRYLTNERTVLSSKG